MSSRDFAFQKAESEVYFPGSGQFSVPVPRSTSEIVKPSAMFLELMNLKQGPLSEAVGAASAAAAVTAAASSGGTVEQG
eukprot:CAMPEP_0197932918 /NCGR_PEP_ID=MMETSP1439-20131203/109329_1 /TAXON_ID=66791 /ORGANISM="Gonyaulax spinifera, Strain CCMP409" /LENGTH=78 /DNA_ID=CAMNT_0043555723 /DNA_START=44 /DNA_END=276 /DNA_ORIENTATION=+